MYKQDPNPTAPINSFFVSGQPAIAADDTGAADIAVGVPQSACSLRNVGTFGVPMDTARADELEVRPGAAPRAQGRSGYNVRRCTASRSAHRTCTTVRRRR